MCITTAGQAERETGQQARSFPRELSRERNPATIVYAEESFDIFPPAAQDIKGPCSAAGSQ